MSLIAAPQTLTYNGITLNVTQVVSVSCRNVYDAAERTVTHVVVSLRVKAVVAAGAAQNATLAAYRVALERPGAALTYTGMSFGGLTINATDLIWGPRPRVLLWRPKGDQAAEIEWHADVAMLHCANAPFRGQVMEAVYSLSVSVDKAGYTTRVHRGLIRIPMTRLAVNNINVPDTADAYFEDWVPAKPDNCERAITRDLDESKCKLVFTVTDTERRGNPLPFGMVEATGSHTLVAETRGVFKVWSGTLSMQCEMERGRPRTEAWEGWKRLMADRLGAARREASTVFLTGMTIGEPELFGPAAASFSVSYRITAPVGGRRRNFFPFGQLWRPVPGTNWAQWSASLRNGAHHPRGHAGYRHRAADDVIVDLCLGDRNTLGARPAWQVDNPRLQGRVRDTWEDIRRLLSIPENPDPAATWLEYHCEITVEPTDHTVVHVPLATKRLTDSTLRTPAARETFPHEGPGFTLKSQETPPPIVQHRASSSYYVTLEGYALRWHYEVPRPELRPVEDATVAECNHEALGHHWRHWLHGHTTHNIFAATWRLRWFVTRRADAQPAFLPIPGHPDQQGRLP